MILSNFFLIRSHFTVLIYPRLSISIAWHCLAYTRYSASREGGLFYCSLYPVWSGSSWLFIPLPITAMLCNLASWRSTPRSGLMSHLVPRVESYNVAAGIRCCGLARFFIVWLSPCFYFFLDVSWNCGILQDGAWEAVYTGAVFFWQATSLGQLQLGTRHIRSGALHFA